MSFFGFIGKVLSGGISVATHGLINLGGGAGSSGGGVGSASALPYTTRLVAGGSGAPRMPTFSLPRLAAAGGGPGPNVGSSLIPHIGCGVGFHHKKEKHGILAGKCVKNRHMAVTNPRALRRAIRRLYGAEKMYARLLRVTHPHKIRGGRVHPKPPRRRKS
jgi:hypothetical protein